MQPIELTKEHKEKLLEMCNKLFPVYSNWWMTYQNGNSDSKDSTKIFVHYTDKEGKQVTIHWYQFCLTELPKRIYKTLKKEKREFALNNFTVDRDIQDLRISYHDDTLEGLMNYTLHSNNPVDFLWNFVQDCKKNKYFKK